MNISISTGAVGLPSTRPVCGMPLKRAFASAAPSSWPDQFALPTFGRPLMSLAETTLPPPLLPPPPLLLRTTPSTIATTATRTTPPTIASTRGEAWRARVPPAPFERTGGGAATAASLRCCLALLPLGMSGKGSRLLGGFGGREDQESDEKQKAGERERRDRDVPEFVDPLRAAPACRRCEARGRLLDHLVLDQQVVDRDAGADDRQREEVARGPVVVVPCHQQEEDREWVHADPLEPAELARWEPCDLREEKAAAGRNRGDDECRPELVAPEQPADPADWAADVEEREQPDQDEEGHDHLTDYPEPPEHLDRVVDRGRDQGERRPAAGYPARQSAVTLTRPGWRNWSDAPGLKSGGPRAVRVQVPPPASLNQAEAPVSARRRGTQGRGGATYGATQSRPRPGSRTRRVGCQLRKGPARPPQGKFESRSQLVRPAPVTGTRP